MAIASFEHREYFHLLVLRQLAPRLAGRNYAVKGGICLRFFHRSSRLSEDMDLDIAEGVRVDTLAKAVDAVLNSQALLASLAPRGIGRLRISKPKQTGITQRWKVGLVLGNDLTLATKIEFSRRQNKITSTSGLPDGRLLSQYRLPSFAASFYDAVSMTEQKLFALAADARYAVRDLFDLHHLFFVAGVDPARIRTGMPQDVLRSALEKIGRFSREDFLEQVAPFLTEDLASLADDPGAFERLCSDVKSALRPEIQ